MHNFLKPPFFFNLAKGLKPWALLVSKRLSNRDGFKEKIAEKESIGQAYKMVTK